MYYDENHIKKTVCGIVAEFNPFHTGHAYLIEEAKKITGCDECIIAMSGNFVQDGTPAIVNKYVRTKQSLLCGASIVFELPSVYATMSAEGFAFGAVATLMLTGVCDYLCFGSETGDLETIKKIAALTHKEPLQLSGFIKEEVAKGTSYPKARANAIIKYLENDTDVEKIKKILESPNDILGIEYCKALLALNEDITPVPIKRIAVSHGKNAEVLEHYTSATNIRSMILEKENFTPFIPKVGIKTLNEAFKFFAPVSNEALVPYIRFLQYQLLNSFHEADEASTYMDTSKDFLNRLLQTDFTALSYDGIVQALKSKNLTQTHIQRALLHLLVKQPNIPRYQLPYYLRLLGFNKNCTYLRKAIKQRTKERDLPIITKPADYKALLYPESLISFEKQLQYDDLYTLLLSPQMPLHSELKQGPVII